MGRNGIQLIRMWLCQWSIFGSDWNPWKGVGAVYYTPWTWLSYDPGTSPQSEFAVWIDQDNNKCMSYGVNTYHPAVKPNTQYRVRISYKTGNVAGPRVAGHPYGLVVKLLHIFDTGTCGEWDFGGQMQYGKYITPFQSADVSTWQILQGTFTTDPGQYFLPYIHLAMENANSGSWATVRQIWIEEVLGNGQYGPNIVSKPSMDHHLYIDHRNAFAFDRVVEMAKQNGVYLRPVILFWQETILNSLDWNGNYTSTQSNSYYYGDGNYGMTRGRWLQTQWYRYMQARWGYSTAIHSWEFTNEGTPGAEHAAAANYFGRVMHGRYSAGTYDPTRYYGNWHLSATSIWAGNTANWGLDNYPDIDFADFHQYIPRSDPNFYDSAQATYDASMANGRVGRPVMRGETGFTDSGSEPPTSALQADTAGVWLHNFVWGGINPGGVLESYWYSNYHICTTSFDLRPQYKTNYEFAKGVRLNNGFFVDAAATAPTGVRAWGQKDLTNGQAILWISNASHTWDNVVNNRSITPRSGTVVVGGFQASKDYKVEWWDTYQADPAQMVTRRETVRTDGSGNLALAISNLTTDVAVKVSSAGIPAAPKNLRIR
jgi:hypothetical protein